MVYISTESDKGSRMKKEWNKKVVLGLQTSNPLKDRF